MGEAADLAPMCASGKEKLNGGRSNDCGGILYENGVEAAVDTADWNNADDVQYVCSCNLLQCLKTDNTKEAFPTYIYVRKSLFVLMHSVYWGISDRTRSFEPRRHLQQS